MSSTIIGPAPYGKRFSTKDDALFSLPAVSNPKSIHLRCRFEANVDSFRVTLTQLLNRTDLCVVKQTLTLLLIPRELRVLLHLWRPRSMSWWAWRPLPARCHLVAIRIHCGFDHNSRTPGKH